MRCTPESIDLLWGQSVSGVNEITVQVGEPVLQQALPPKAAVEYLNVDVARRIVWLAEVQPTPVPIRPGHDHPSGHVTDPRAITVPK